MKALLLAGGRGTRLGPLTQDTPKPMLPIGGVPMLERIMTGIARQTAIREFVLVTGYKAEAVQSHFGTGAKWGWSIEYVHQAEQKGLGHAIQTAHAQLSGAAFLMTYGDIMLSPDNYGRVLEIYNTTQTRNLAAVMGLNYVDDPWAGAAVYVDDANVVQRIEEKPARGTATTHWNNAGLFIFEPILFKYTAKLQPSPRGELELPDALSALMAAGYQLQGMPLTGEWRDVGTPEDYAAINAEYGTASSEFETAQP